MKLHFTYNLPDLTQALKIAQQTAEFADIIGVGSLLLFKEGVRAIQSFKSAFPSKEIFAEARVSEKPDEVIAMMAQAGASYISVSEATFTSCIKKAAEAAKRHDINISLDLLGAPSLGQLAMDAKTLGVHSLIVHRAPNPEEAAEHASEWRDVRDNTKLPIFVTGKIDESNFKEIVDLKPYCIMIGAAITKADNPAKAAHFFRSLM